MSRKSKITVSIVFISVFVLALIGFTYGYYLTKVHGNTNDKSIDMTISNLKLAYSDGTNVIAPSSVLYPGNSISKTFDVTNKGDATEYVVVIEDINVIDTNTGESTTLNSNDFVYKLECTSTQGSCNEEETEETFPMSASIITENSIVKGATQKYTFTLTYKKTDVDQSPDSDKVISAKINIKPYQYDPSQQ